jgi:small subunit ribosomal protein S4
VNIPSYQVKPGDVIGVHESKMQTDVMKQMRSKLHTRALPDWLQFDTSEMVGTVLAVPTRDQIDTPVQEQLIVEFYSR